MSVHILVFSLVFLAFVLMHVRWRGLQTRLRSVVPRCVLCICLCTCLDLLDFGLRVTFKIYVYLAFTAPQHFPLPPSLYGSFIYSKHAVSILGIYKLTFCVFPHSPIRLLYNGCVLLYNGYVPPAPHIKVTAVIVVPFRG